MTWVATAVIVAAAVSAKTGYDAKQSAKKSRRLQEKAANEQRQRALSDARRGQMAEAKAIGRRKPDTATLLGQERLAAQSGPSATLLSQGGGTGAGSLLGQSGGLLG